MQRRKMEVVRKAAEFEEARRGTEKKDCLLKTREQEKLSQTHVQAPPQSAEQTLARMKFLVADVPRSPPACKAVSPTRSIATEAGGRLEDAVKAQIVELHRKGRTPLQIRNHYLLSEHRLSDDEVCEVIQQWTMLRRTLGSTSPAVQVFRLSLPLSRTNLATCMLLCVYADVHFCSLASFVPLPVSGQCLKQCKLTSQEMTGNDFCVHTG